MAWNWQEAAQYYKRQGAPSDQTALVSLLREVQAENGGGIPGALLASLAQELGTKESFLMAVIKRIPSLKLADTHLLELCDGPNCPKRAALGAFVEKTYGKQPAKFTLKYVPCMRLCGKGPNLRWDGKVYHGATEELIRKLVEKR